MCGIIGYIGEKPVVPVLIDGLRRLEYRGYDSAGVALVRNGDVEVRRSAGKLARLEEALADQPVDGDYGLGHTRWATHGRPTEENAHPHRDCTGRIVVVHNGIIENYLQLKLELEDQGHRFETETDTEIVAHLVEREMRDDGLEQAVRRALTHVRGLFGMVLLAADDPHKLVAVRNGPPIVVGMGDREFLVASDVPAVLSYTRDVVFLGDEEMAVVTRDGVTFTDFTGAPVETTTQRIAWDPVMAEKAGYKHFMLKEIFEQPWAIQETVLGRGSLQSGQVFLGELEISNDRLQAVDRIVILACGTSWHAALVGKFLIERLVGVPVEVDYGSEYRYRDPIVASTTLAVVITQSGETADTLAALREARGKGAMSIAICNVVGSMATREADGTVYTHAGPEIGVASTKAFTSQLVALHLLALYLAQVRGALPPETALRHLTELNQVPRLIEQTLKCDEAIQAIAQRFYAHRNFLFLGRGINYPIALEGALKLKEISYIHAEGYPAGEMKHGPIALIDEQMPVVALLPAGQVFEKMAANLQEAKARGGAVIALTDDSQHDIENLIDRDRDALITVPASSPLITPIVMVVPLQLLAYHISVRRGCDVDQPRNLAKSVTVE
ncbi:MAG: glutamine--fructose-6-phosphate transaminase (isomerizing) [Acidobacteria bacterium]|jgi:glucosamine--fructose-6-phosphate aminotransferase (isomerizing)|nr:glutamine--fructose-6-phosphate transaminase (isomerizing) [Acidobacteriota bacterium]MDP7337945.1 glutamine--fructose-6-phosphate transaminase (isomerizing) [Vicinamibacterales bacterium]MDP7480913.1 glutamine--fructose-6-phosphate transaminase (isomerizing) [Vicinamibacterales bacterium]MDP7691101.1 glutamine--fructose-6-phosphate transaminase (isomerizing) [Vicinamibacterales bacterium]HJN44372.1 glutamine--fructose-6-phosphate transaminase (isomerizing) [Vicinamibacterales bacterium]|tara:strand:- start:1025 stop:2869 length:1845 start_codon:yes stop_codon:yes gene_type:complete